MAQCVLSSRGWKPHLGLKREASVFHDTEYHKLSAQFNFTRNKALKEEEVCLFKISTHNSN